MIRNACLFGTFFLGFVLFSQTKKHEINNNTDYEAVKIRVSKGYYANKYSGETVPPIPVQSVPLF
jgi:hypothetical protein